MPVERGWIANECLRSRAFPNRNTSSLIRYLVEMGWGICHTHPIYIRDGWTAKRHYRYFSVPIFKCLILNYPIPRFVWTDSFDASSSPKILDVVLNCPDAYPKNHRELSWGYVRIVSDLRQNFLSVGRHLGIGFIPNFIPNFTPNRTLSKSWV